MQAHKQDLGMYGTSLIVYSHSSLPDKGAELNIC